MTRVLLFGASGFIGREVRIALDKDPRVTHLICPDPDCYNIVSGDFSDLVELIRVAESNVFISCAGQLYGTSADLMLGNAVLTAKLIDAIGVAARGARFVRIGSAGEYGQVPWGQAISEDHPAEPISEYGISHLAATRLTSLASKMEKIDGVVLRVFNPIGRRPSGENLLGRAASLIYEAVQAGDNHITLGPLAAYRDFVDTRDVASAVVNAALAQNLSHRIFNVASGISVTARSAVESLARIGGFEGEIVERGGGSARSAAVGYICADINRIKDALSWSPLYTLEETLQSLWDEKIGQ